MLPENLTTNEVKVSAGTEIEFLHHQKIGTRKEYRQSAEVPSKKHRIVLQHQEQGLGMKAKRRSNLSVSKEVLSEVDGSSIVPIIFSCTVQVPTGHLLTLAEVKNVIAEGISLLASTGANTTILFDCTGYGAESLVNGSL